MTEQQYQLRKTAILHELQSGTKEVEQRLLALTESTAAQLLTLEQEYQGVTLSPFCACKNQCLACNGDIPLGEPYCADCSERIRQAEEANPLLALDLTSKRALLSAFGSGRRKSPQK